MNDPRNDPVTGPSGPCPDGPRRPCGPIAFGLSAVLVRRGDGQRGSPRVTMGATMGWPAMGLVGFRVLIGVVVVLGTSSTARYEFEHNGARERQRSAVQRQ